MPGKFTIKPGHQYFISTIYSSFLLCIWILDDEGDPAPSAASGDVGFGSSCVIWELQKLNKGLQDLRQDVANLESKVDTLSGSLNDKFQGELLTAQNENYVLKDEKRILAASHFRSEQNIRKWMTIEQDLKKQQEDLVKQLGGEIEKRKETEKRLEDILKKFQEEQVKRVDIEKRLEDLMRKLEGQANLHE